jgi:hypothetical protein
VRALHPFTPTEAGELGFEKGDVIKVGVFDWCKFFLLGRRVVFFWGGEGRRDVVGVDIGRHVVQGPSSRRFTAERVFPGRRVVGLDFRDG